MRGQDPESERATTVCKDTSPGMQSSGFLRKLVKQKARGAEPEARIDLSASGLLKIVADADRCEELTAEIARLTELWMDAVREYGERNKQGRYVAAYPESFGRDTYLELEKRGLAEGSDCDGWVLKWPGDQATPKGPTASLTVNLDHEDLKRLIQKAVDEHAAEVTLLTELWEAVKALRDVETGRVTLHGRTIDYFYSEVDQILEALEPTEDGE